MGFAELSGLSATDPVLTKEERELFRRFHEHEDLNAARTIVLSHLRYVAYVARNIWVTVYRWKI